MTSLFTIFSPGTSPPKLPKQKLMISVINMYGYRKRDSFSLVEMRSLMN